MQSSDLQDKYINDEKFRVNVNKLMGLPYVPVLDSFKAYSSITTNLDVEDNRLLNYFERIWVGPKKAEVY